MFLNVILDMVANVSTHFSMEKTGFFKTEVLYSHRSILIKCSKITIERNLKWEWNQYYRKKIPTFWFGIISTFPSVADIKRNRSKKKEDNMQCEHFWNLVYKIYQPTEYFLRYSVRIFEVMSSFSLGRAHPWSYLSENLCEPLILQKYLPQTYYLSEILSGFVKNFHLCSLAPLLIFLTWEEYSKYNSLLCNSL